MQIESAIIGFNAPFQFLFNSSILHYYEYIKGLQAEPKSNLHYQKFNGLNENVAQLVSLKNKKSPFLYEYLIWKSQKPIWTESVCCTPVLGYFEQPQNANKGKFQIWC